MSVKIRKVLFDQIESRNTSPGFPDTVFLIKGTHDQGTIELKYSNTLPKKIELEKTQVVWNRRRARHGGRCFISIKVGRDLIYTWSGEFARELRTGKGGSGDKINIYNLPFVKTDLSKNGWSDYEDLLRGKYDNQLRVGVRK